MLCWCLKHDYVTSAKTFRVQRARTRLSVTARAQPNSPKKCKLHGRVLRKKANYTEITPTVKRCEVVVIFLVIVRMFLVKYQWPYICTSSYCKADLQAWLIGCLHDPANFQQSSSKRPANIQLAWWNPAPYQPISCLPRRLSDFLCLPFPSLPFSFLPFFSCRPLQ